ncbi:MAG: hypothetical protein JXQ29_08600 [Planctomycetes bacterium]|nr:hypothetical protein [Planctomycetota bacterium]
MVSFIPVEWQLWLVPVLWILGLLVAGVGVPLIPRSRDPSSPNWKVLILLFGIGLIGAGYALCLALFAGDSI